MSFPHPYTSSRPIITSTGSLPAYTSNPPPNINHGSLPSYSQLGAPPPSYHAFDLPQRGQYASPIFHPPAPQPQYNIGSDISHLPITYYGPEGLFNHTGQLILPAGAAYPQLPPQQPQFPPLQSYYPQTYPQYIQPQLTALVYQTATAPQLQYVAYPAVIQRDSLDETPASFWARHFGKANNGRTETIRFGDS